MRTFVLWILIVVPLLAFHTLYFGSLGAKYLQVFLVEALCALALINLLAQAMRVGKASGTIIAAFCLVGTYASFAQFRETELLFKVLGLLGIFLVLNVAVGVYLHQRKLRGSGRA
jgi:hypothetical protein